MSGRYEYQTTTPIGGKRTPITREAHQRHEDPHDPARRRAARDERGPRGRPDRHLEQPDGVREETGKVGRPVEGSYIGKMRKGIVDEW